MSSTIDYYHILGVTPSADLAVIKAVYKALALKFHPDRNKESPDVAAKRMSEINEAYSVLSDATSPRLQ
jgi:curved DNA-binding protein CbpA